MGVDDADAGGLAFCFVVDDGVNDAVGAEREFAGALGPGDGGGIGVEVAAEGAAAFAEATGLALAAALFEVDGLGFCEVGAAADDHRAVGVSLQDLFLYVLFYAIHFPGRQEFSVGQLGEAVFVAADAGEFLYVTIPGGEVVVADGPGDGDAVAGGAFELEGAPALGLAGPEQGFAAYLVAPDPVERFFLDIGMFLVFYEEVLGGFAVGVAAGHDGVVVEDFQGELAAVGKVPGIFCGGGIVLEVFHGAAAFEQEGCQALFAEFFCGPAAADAGADDDGVVLGHMGSVECSNLVKKKQLSGMGNLIMNCPGGLCIEISFYPAV